LKFKEYYINKRRKNKGKIMDGEEILENFGSGEKHHFSEYIPYAMPYRRTYSRTCSGAMLKAARRYWHDWSARGWKAAPR
jgi:hypothetical protein